MTCRCFGPSSRAAAAAAILAVGLGACAEGTGLGVNVVPQEQVQAMGVESWRTIRAETPASDNAAYQQTAREVASRVLRAAGRNPQQWEVLVFEGDEANAFALPGGKIGVYEGILRLADTPDQLAAVIGHEVAHVEAHHAAERVNTDVATQLGTQLISAALGAANVGAPAQVAQVIGTGVQYGVTLPYSRNQELQADEMGLRYMAQAGYDPRAAITLWQRMQSGGRPPAFLSTHPAPEQRIAALQAQLPEVMGVYQAKR